MRSRLGFARTSLRTTVEKAARQVLCSRRIASPCPSSTPFRTPPPPLPTLLPPVTEWRIRAVGEGTRRLRAGPPDPPGPPGPAGILRTRGAAARALGVGLVGGDRAAAFRTGESRSRPGSRAYSTGA